MIVRLNIYVSDKHQCFYMAISLDGEAIIQKLPSSLQMLMFWMLFEPLTMSKCVEILIL